MDGMQRPLMERIQDAETCEPPEKHAEFGRLELGWLSTWRAEPRNTPPRAPEEFMPVYCGEDAVWPEGLVRHVFHGTNSRNIVERELRLSVPSVLCSPYSSTTVGEEGR